MSGPRAAKYVDVKFAPGVVTNETDRGAVSRWKDCNRVRWHKSLPEKFGGFEWIELTGANGGTYIGVARTLHDWSSLDTAQWIGIGTHCKLYLVNNLTLHDITPIRKNSTVVDPFETTNGSEFVTINDPDHRAEPGDHITIFGASAVGGLTLDGAYEVISILGVDSYTVDAGAAASSDDAGGGVVTIQYDLPCGLESNGELRGYGTGLFGEGTYGTPRVSGTGVPARLRTWSMDNWGEDLVASPSGGTLYWWDRTNGPNSRAQRVANAPAQIQRILVNPENRILIALGCTGIDGQPDKMLVRWCDQEDFDTWLPSTTNLAGGKRLDYGSEIITGIRSRGQNLIWTDVQLYAMEFTGESDFVFTFQPLGNCSIIGPNAAIDVNGVVYFLGIDDFFIYDGTLRPLPCDVWTFVFDNLDRSQAEKVVASSFRRKNEVRWDFPVVEVRVTEDDIERETEEEDIRITEAGENGAYAIFNYAEGVWYYGQQQRTAYHDVSRAISGTMTHPYGTNQGYLYKHEYGTDEVEEAGTNLQEWFLESYDVHVGGSDAHFLVNSLVPDYDVLEGEHRFTLKKKRYPLDAYTERGPYTINPDTPVIDVRARGSQIALRIENGAELGQHWRMGTWQALVTPYGGR